MTLPRIRQLVFASKEQEDISRLQDILQLGKPFVDPGIAEFGLTNGVFALGDQFLEVVVPVEDNTAAGRFMKRSNGVGGYMTIFQTDNLEGVRDRADEMQIRRVWNADLPDISASHLHPADIGAAIVSIDEARPAESWRWGGPNWQNKTVPGHLKRLVVTAKDPSHMAQKWGKLLSVQPQGKILNLQGSSIEFASGDRDHLSFYELMHTNPKACLDRAQAHGLQVQDSSFYFCGVEVSISPN